MQENQTRWSWLVEEQPATAGRAQDFEDTKFGMITVIRNQSLGVTVVAKFIDSMVQ